MAFENLFIRTKKAIGGIQLDAVLTESHSNTVRKTTNPIELGADITDHAIAEPKTISIVAEVSDTPLGAAAIGEIVDLVTGLFGSATTNNITRSNAAYNAMVQLQEAREPIEIQTKLKLYQNMLITSIRVSQDKDTSRIVRMFIDAEEIFITASEVVQLTEDELAAESSAFEQAATAEKKGKQGTPIPGPTTQKSIFKTVKDWVTK